MKILHTADWHLGTFRSPVRDGVNLRTEDTKRCLDELVRVAEKERPDYSLVSGDVFHVGRLWSDRCCEEILTAIHYIKELASVSGHVVVMRGTPNHDGAGQFKVLSEMFADCPNVHIAVTPQVIPFDDVDIAVLPGFDRGVYRAKFPGLSGEEENEVFTKELSNIVTGLKAVCTPGRKSVLMAHYTVPGCNTESGQTMMLTQFEPVIPQEALIAADYDLVALGHIHRPQRILSHDWYYSGAINAMNFNDEGQERGFWIHEWDPAGTMRSEFHGTPYRGFATFSLTDADIAAINLGHTEEVAINHWKYNGAADKIVRVHYSCSAENNKALNKAELERELLDDGAFMVWEILPDKISETANRTELAGATDPEANLVRYLEEKRIPEEKIQELVMLARPVIAEAEAGATAAANTGVFEPVEISVRNYRNYEEETFNFEDITFCTINGVNGAGKSSLFMDAIIDCLYEEPREGVIRDDSGKPPWLRNDEKARSGSIMFTFRIGEKKFRVTRARARSGKGTLNVAQFVDGEWVDRSKERYNDTQKEIFDILGMDSFTFKSCALIMQDQYGIFLQAKPEERVEVLGTLLGLGVYKAMEKIASDRAKANGAKYRELKQTVTIHDATIAEYGKPDEELAECKKELELNENALREKTGERDRMRLLLANRQEAAARREKALAAVTAMQAKRTAAEQNRAMQQAIADSSAALLAGKAEIEEKITERGNLLKRELELAGQSALYSSKKQEAESCGRQAETEESALAAYKARLAQKENELKLAQPTEQDEVVREKAGEYARKKSELDTMQELAVAYQKAKNEYSAAVFRREQIRQGFAGEKQAVDERKKALEKKVAILGESGCVDIDNARCKFLQDAIDAKYELAALDGRYADIAARREAELSRTADEVDKRFSAMEAVGFDAEAFAILRCECGELSAYVPQMEAISRRENQIALISAEIEHIQSNIAESTKRLDTVKLRASQAESERDTYAAAFEEHARVMSAITALDPWVEKEKQIPVAEERKTTALNRITELSLEILSVDAEIAEKQAEAEKELPAMAEMDKIAGDVARMDADIAAITAVIRSKQMAVGALQQKAEHIARLQQEIAALKEREMEYAARAANYDTLKTAFSQSGIPHQIIRSVIPQLTATANSILGQMTAGKMGVEFRLERLQKNGKEKVSLDIFIEEYGRSVLPYLSKSGGEKVKSSLSVILALAELKSSSAGVQLGMLFIDEPPFLDGDGIQAYCDALETIRSRYDSIKIMAITHDPTMKARFPQNIDVVKTENGSKVIY